MNNNVRNHIVISGTGRAGTTFLVQLLTKLGFNTGFENTNMKVDENARAGLELDIREENAPYVVKSPWFCDYVEEVVKRDDIKLDFVIIPVRDVKAAAQSRWSVYQNTPLLKRLLTKPSYIHGGMWGAFTRKKQERVLVNKLYNLIFSLSETNTPIILLRYPKLVKDSEYLHAKLNPVLKNIDKIKFEEAYRMTVKPDLVHKFNKNDK